MQSTPLQDGRMCDKMGTRNLVLRVALNGVPTVRGPRLRGIRCQAAREMLLPCPLEATLQQMPPPNALKPSAPCEWVWGASPGVGAGSAPSKNCCFSLVETYLHILQDLPRPALSLLKSPIPPRAGSPTPTHNRTDSSQARRESLHHNYPMAASENLQSESLL